MFSYNNKIIRETNDNILFSDALSLEEYITAFDLETSNRLEQTVSIMKSINSKTDIKTHTNGLTFLETSPHRPIAFVNVQKQYIEVYICIGPHCKHNEYFAAMNNLFGILNSMRAKYKDGIAYFYHNKKFPISLVKRVLEICNEWTFA